MPHGVPAAIIQFMECGSVDHNEPQQHILQNYLVW